MNPYPSLLTEHDIRMFLGQPPKFFVPIKTIALSLVGIAVLSSFGYGILNYNALLRVANAAPEVEKPLLAPTPLPKAAAVSTPTPEPAPTIPESTINASSLNISAPVSWDTSFDETIIQQKLRDGVVHLQGTAKPGQQGFVVITGHSSNYPWIKGQYNTIFAPLHKAALDQLIEINYQNRQYTYKVTKVYQIKPEEVEVLQQGEGSGLRLITCTPIGTSLRRLVVEAIQITPNPAGNTTFTGSIFSNSIPGAR